MNQKIIVITSLLLTVVLVSCHNTSNDAIEINEVESTNQEFIEISEKQFVSSGFETSKIQMHEFSSQLSVSGMIDLPLRSKYAITTYIDGVVQGMNLLEGHAVKKGDILFVLSNPELIDLQQQYLEVNSQLEYLQEETARQKIMADENISAKKNLLKAQADLKFALAKEAGLSKKLELMGISPTNLTVNNFRSRINVIAPISGYISKLTIGNGSHLNASEKAMELSSYSGLHLELKVLEKDISKIKLGQKIKFTIPSSDEMIFNSDVHLIEKNVDENGLLIVHGDLESRELDKLIPGMYVNAKIQLNASQKLSLPIEAVVTIENKSYILIQSPLDKTKYLKKEVTIDASNDRFVSVALDEDITEQSMVLTKGSYYLIAAE